MGNTYLKALLDKDPSCLFEIVNNVEDFCMIPLLHLNGLSFAVQQGSAVNFIKQYSGEGTAAIPISVFRDFALDGTAECRRFALGKRSMNQLKEGLKYYSPKSGKHFHESQLLECEKMEGETKWAQDLSEPVFLLFNPPLVFKKQSESCGGHSSKIFFEEDYMGSGESTLEKLKALKEEMQNLEKKSVDQLRSDARTNFEKTIALLIKIILENVEQDHFELSKGAGTVGFSVEKMSEFLYQMVEGTAFKTGLSPSAIKTKVKRAKDILEIEKLPESSEILDLILEMS